MKTVIQELIDELKANDVANGMYWIKQPNKFFEKYLNKEYEQIIDAHFAGYIIGVEYGINKTSIETAREYYDQTYNQNK